MNTTKTLLKGGTVLTLDADLGNFSKADVLIVHDKIAAIAPTIEAEDNQVIDASNMIVMPGFVDTHRHLWETAIRGIAADSTLMQYLHTVLGQFAPLYRPEDVYVGNLLGALEAIDAGITTIFDWSHIMNTPEHAGAAITALRKAGVRAIFGYGTPGTSVWEWFYESKRTHPTDIERIQKQYFSSADDLLTLALAIRGPEHSTIDVTKHDIALARRLGLRASMHMGGGTFGPRYKGVTQLYRAGLLGSDLNVAHGNTLSDEDLHLLAEYGCSLSITPEVEMQMGIGWPITGKALTKGIRTGLGVDVVTSAAGDLFTQMKIALQTERAITNQEYLSKGEMPQQVSIHAKDILKMATMGGAEAIGLAHKTGSLTVGKQADIILINTKSISLSPVNDPVSTVVLRANPAHVDTVFVAGKILKSQGKLLHHDLGKLQAELLASRNYLVEQSEKLAYQHA